MKEKNWQLFSTKKKTVDNGCIMKWQDVVPKVQKQREAKSIVVELQDTQAVKKICHYFLHSNSCDLALHYLEWVKNNVRSCVDLPFLQVEGC